VVDVALELELARALYESGRGADAVTRSESLIERSRTQGNRVGELAGKLQAGYVLQDLEPEGAAERLDALIAEALPELQAAGDDDALYTAHLTRGMVAFSRAQGDAAVEAWELAARHARAARIPDELVGWRALARLYGATPVTEVLAWLDENEPLHGRDDWLRASRGVALAMLGRFEEGRAILTATRTELTERGGGVQLAVLTAMESALIERLAGDPATAAVLGAEGCKLLEELEAQSFLSTAAAYLAGSLYELGRLDEADAWAERAAEVGDRDDLFTQPLWRLTRAKILARRGVPTEAERLVREAVSLTESTQDLHGLGDAHADLAEVLLLAERSDEAAAALERALECYDRKESLASAERTRRRLEVLAASA
jgi:tetratricopeptide (TPR) repeat protein